MRDVCISITNKERLMQLSSQCGHNMMESDKSLVLLGYGPVHFWWGKKKTRDRFFFAPDAALPRYCSI